METIHKFSVASRYIESIRNPLKKKYARAYYQWLREPECVRGDSPEYAPLSYMGAQAVRMRLTDIFERTAKNEQAIPSSV